MKTVILHFIVTFLNLNTTVKSYFIYNFVILYLSMLDVKNVFYWLFNFLLTVHLIMFEHLFFAVVLKKYLKCALINGKQSIDIVFLYKLEHIQMSLSNDFIISSWKYSSIIIQIVQYHHAPSSSKSIWRRAFKQEKDLLKSILCLKELRVMMLVLKRLQVCMKEGAGTWRSELRSEPFSKQHHDRCWQMAVHFWHSCATC